MTSQGMMLRNHALVGQTKTVHMPDNCKPLFEEGVSLLFQRWTALQLAVQNQWGGSKSVEKANELILDVIDWFYTTKVRNLAWGQAYIDIEQSDLEELLDEGLQVEFNVQAEDDSPYQVARSLINMHNQVASGDTSYVESLRALQAPPSSASQQEIRPKVPGEDDDDDSSSSSSGSEEEDDQHDKGDAMDVDDQLPQSRQPIVDEDGFQVVQRKGRR